MNDKNKSFTGASYLSLGGFAVRLIGALLLVLATYNPTDLSYVDWVRTSVSDGNLGPEHFFVGVIIVIGWTIFIVASMRALGPLGLGLGAAFFATLVWLLIDFEVLSARSAESVIWICLVCVALLLAIGVSWSHIWRRATGQLEVDTD